MFVGRNLLKYVGAYLATKKWTTLCSDNRHFNVKIIASKAAGYRDGE